ncbi:MAG TPA: hypothetical protein VGL20_09815 [Candidatus Dormibacteraeota bacterium]|jgi:predicted DNA binding CopG/RHH family protein
MTVKATDKVPGPQPDGSFYDPYEAMTDEEFHAQAEELFSRPQRVPSTKITIRLPDDLVMLLKRMALDTGVPYQTLTRRILVDAVPKYAQAAAHRSKVADPPAARSGSRTAARRGP